MLQYQEMVWGTPAPTEAIPTPKRIGTDHYHFDAIETPGHTQGHIAVLKPDEGWSFTGDILVTKRPKAFQPREDASEIIESMRKLIKLQTQRLILFTRLGRILQDGRAAFESCADYLEYLSRKVENLAAKGLPVAAIREELSKESSLAPLTQGDFSAENLIRSILRQI